MREYEAILQVYQAQNAVGIARTAGAGKLAPNTLAEAERMLAEAKRLQSMNADSSLVVQNARAAAQTAEDARLIAERREQEQKLAEAQRTAGSAQQAKVEAQMEAQRARAEAEAARARADAERLARERAEAALAAQRQAQAASRQADRSESVPVEPPPADAARKSETRMRLLEAMNGILATRDTPAGLTVTVPDAAFSGYSLRSADAARVSQVAVALAATPGLKVEVEGHTDSPSTAGLALSRAQEIRTALVRGGLAPSAVTVQGLGASRPVTGNSSESGRIANRRVTIVISGEPLGNLPFWDRTYSLHRR